VLATPGSEKPDSEYVSELYDSVHLREWLMARPNVQLIVNPGGYHDLRNVAVLGMKSAVIF
jgi:carbohydrate-selective porin OprB